MLEVRLQAKDDLISGSRDYWQTVGITWPGHYNDFAILSNLIFYKKVKCYGYVILTLYHSYVISILTPTSSLILFFAFNWTLNKYLFYLSYKATIYFTIL